MIRVALYSQDRTLQPLLASALGTGFQVFLALGAPAREFDVMILDVDAHHRAAAERKQQFEELIASRVPALIMADESHRDMALDLVDCGAFGLCRRPPSIRELKAMLARAYESARATAEVASTSRDEEQPYCEGMIGSSETMQQVYRMVHRVADLNASVLILGESGSGKELIARAIHRQGERARRPFVAVSCGAIPETLIEAELFGHEKGAFTGATEAREGYFEKAGDGTLFLDEIGDLSLYTQVKLLRVLQQLEFNRLGSSKALRLGARLIFATHRDLAGMVEQGTFRQDLYYRINVVRIDAPPLREHPEDIPQIAEHLLRCYSMEFRKPVERIDAHALGLLARYEWPGNVRELENIIQRAIILAGGDTLRAEDLPANLRAQNVIEMTRENPGASFEQRISDFKVKLATDALRENNGNKTLAARRLNISRAYLHRLIRGPEREDATDAKAREMSAD